MPPDIPHLIYIFLRIDLLRECILHDKEKSTHPNIPRLFENARTYLCS